MESFARILVITFAQLGDALLVTPLIRAARERWPSATIDVLGYAGSLHLLKGNPDISTLIEVNKRDRIGQQLRQAARLWRRYDLALVTRPGDRSHIYGFIAGRRRSVMLPYEGQGTGWKRWLAHHHFGTQPGMHQVVEKLQMLTPWREMPPAIAVQPPPSQPLPDELQRQLVHPNVVVHVPSMWRYKQWPTDHYRTVVETLLANGVQVLLTGSSSDNDQALVADVRGLGSAPQLIDLSGRISLQQVCTLLQQTDAYLGPDTSVTHLAAALAVPIVTLYGPTAPDVFGPWPPQHPATQPWTHRVQRQEVHRIALLQGPDLPHQQCVPCGRMGCEDHRDSASHCLMELPPSRVLAELSRLLGRPLAASVVAQQA